MPDPASELLVSQIDGLLEGEGSSEDHEDVLAFLKRSGLPEDMVKRVHRAIVGAERILANDLNPYANAAALEAVLATEDDRPYIRLAKADPNEFVPHQWVIDAIKNAYTDGKTVAGMEHQFLVQQMEEQHQLDQNNIMRAAVAAVLEEVPWVIQANDSISVNVNMEEQRTIWDRATLTSTMSPDQKDVTWTLTSHKALPKAE